MRITGARVFDIDRFTERDLYIRDGIIRSIEDVQDSNGRKSLPEDDMIIDAGGLYALPGLVDIHFHGAAGYDFCDGSLEAIEKIAEYEASIGVTAICPATMTYPKEKLMKIMGAARRYCEQESQASEVQASEVQYRGTNNLDVTSVEQSSLIADFLGINMEGPFISREKTGAQNPDFVIEAGSDLTEALEMIKDLQKESGNLIKLIDLAPECGNNLELIAAIRQFYPDMHISLAHTNCDYDTAKRAFAKGADHMTHLFNAMPGLHHRTPGPIPAAVEAGAYVEVIADGIHVHPAMVRLAFQTFGPERMILISDSMRACGLEDGIYDLGGQKVRVQGRKATLEEDENTIAGSVTNLFDCMKIAVKEMGIPLADAVRAATYNPARSLGLEGEIGSLMSGRKGTVLLVNEDVELVRVIRE